MEDEDEFDNQSTFFFNNPEHDIILPGGVQQFPQQSFIFGADQFYGPR
jgi:hypothetical protein